MKDYMFAPGRTGYDRGVRDLFRRRAETELIITSQHELNPNRRVRIRRLKDMLLTVNFNGDIDRPLRKVFIGTHGNDSGWMQIQFDAVDVNGDNKVEANTTYEVLENIDTTDAFHFEDAAKNDDTHVHIRGCLIGQDFARPFVELLKKVMGDEVPVSAPKHYHVVVRLPNAGHMEFFGYQFQVSVLSRFRGRDARSELIEAFKEASFFFIDAAGGHFLEDEWWEKWIPRNVSLGKRTIRHRVNFEPPILPRRGNPIVRMNIPLPKAFRAVRQQYRYTVTGVTSDPGNLATRIELVHNVIRADDDFKVAHPFPIYKRYEFDTIDQFFEGFNWRVTYNSRKEKLYATGSRYLYTVNAPITSDPDANDDTKNHLIFNFNPNANNTNPAISLIDEEDDDLFLIV